MAHSLKAVPAAGVEPAAPSVSARCSYQLSYTGIGQSQRWDSNPLTPRYEGGARPVEHRWHRGWPVGVEPTRRRFTAGSRIHFGFGHSASARNRTRTSDFADPRDVRFTTEAVGQYPGQESNLDLLVRTEP
jgi:hypothetical protein